MGNSAPHRKTLPLVRLAPMNLVGLRRLGGDSLENGMRSSIRRSNLPLAIPESDILPVDRPSVAAVVSTHPLDLAGDFLGLLTLAHGLYLRLALEWESLEQLLGRESVLPIASQPSEVERRAIFPVRLFGQHIHEGTAKLVVVLTWAGRIQNHGSNQCIESRIVLVEILFREKQDQIVRHVDPSVWIRNGNLGAVDSAALFDGGRIPSYTNLPVSQMDR